MITSFYMALCIKQSIDPLRTMYYKRYVLYTQDLHGSDAPIGYTGGSFLNLCLSLLLQDNMPFGLEVNLASKHYKQITLFSFWLAISS